MHMKFVSVATFTLGLAALPALCATINLSTGLNASNTLITTGAQPDAYWTVSEQAGGNGPAQTVYPNNADWYSGWLANGPNSDWIARNANVTNNGAAPYTFTRTFDLTGYNLATVSLSGAWAIDDQGTLNLNGTPISTLGSGAWGALTTFSASTGFIAGVNTLSMTITADDQFLEAVRLDGTLTGQLGGTATPEPSTSFLLVSGLGMLLFLGRKVIRPN